LTRREVVTVAVGASLLAIVMTWPLLIHLGSVVPRDIGDPLAEAWQPAWGGHALLHQPLHFFDANRFWPLTDSLAFGDALIGYAPTGIIGSGPHAAMVRYDLLFLFAYALAFFGAYLLAREIGLSPAGAVVAGAAFAFAPYRLEQDGHLQVISSGGIPLSIAFALRGIRLRRPWWLFWAWVLAVWQVSIGWILGLPFAYGIGGAVLIAIIAWLVRGRPAVPRNMLIASAAGLVVFVAISYWIAHHYLYIADNYPAAKRSPHEVAAFSGPLKVFLAAPEENWVWGAATAGVRNSLTTLQEKTLFPGLVIVVLALVGMFSSSLSRRVRIGLGIGTVAILVLQLGFREEGGLLWPTYRVLMTRFPDGTRSGPPARHVLDPDPGAARGGRRGGGDPRGEENAASGLVGCGCRRAARPGHRHRRAEPALRPVRQPGDARCSARPGLDQRDPDAAASPPGSDSEGESRLPAGGERRLSRHGQRPCEHKSRRRARPGQAHGELPRRGDRP
jgi:hypothetical protein